MYDGCGAVPGFSIDPDFGTGRPLTWHVCARHLSAAIEAAHLRQERRGDFWICALVEPIDGAVR
jgi:hypothetical protein